MAERPLYTLYKNLKAQNYDVPDDYNKFESALTRDGKGGADNRHAIYENLKAQNFDVPSTYERFYSALFEPRSRTSSRAKGGSVPMSAADRARFSAGASAISASAQQTMNNAGRYNRLKQRKQKQHKDFGRVNLGTHQTPFGGDANNVVKDDFAYNPETGKAGAYVTSDNENAYSKNDAEQKQAILDQQNNAYQEAVDTGEIPSVFDVRDKKGNYDLQENIGKNGTYLTEEGAQKQFDKKLADAYARKKEIEALIAEDNRKHGNPLLSYGASIGAGNGRTAEQSDYRNKLAISLSLITEHIGALEAVKQYPTSSWGEDALKALDNTAFTAKTWDFGLTDFAIMGQMERIKTKMDNNIPLSGSDKMLLKSKLGADAATALEDEKMGNIYRWTKIAGQSLPFMADFFLTGGYGGITKGISRGALKFAAKRGMGKVSAAILKNTGIVAGDVIGSYAMAGTEQALKTGADIMQRHLGNLYQDEKGDYKFGTFDENGNLLHEGGESIGTALYKGMTSAMVENYTEKLFGHNYGIKKGAVNFMEKHGMNASAEFFKNIGKSGWYTNSKKWMEKFGINGFAEEVMEEEIGIPLHALLDGEGKVSDILDAKQQLDIIGGMAISVGSMYAMGAGSRPVKGIYNRAQYYRFRNKVNVADNDAQNLMGDNWADIKDKIDNATNEQMGGVMADILRQRDTMTKEQINAAVNYGVNLMKMRGYNIAKTAEMNAREITNEPTTPEEQHQADIDNAYSEGHDADDADKHDIQIQQEDQMKTLAAALGISEQQLSAMSDEELESLTGQDDKLDQAIYDYQLSSARYQGVVDDAQDKVDLAAHQAEQRVDMYTDQSRGSVRNATIKASGGLEDYGVYIISGNIATNEDGSIDVSNSDGMILYYDPTTNSVEHADALMFAELGEELPADEVKAQAVADAKENAIKEVAGIIDGTVEVGSQFNVTDTDGTEHTYEVLADYGDGTAAISIDGNVVDNPYSLADLQHMKDLEDQKRMEAAKAEREQMEKERTEQQNQETEQTQPSFDFNKILNDNGNVVLVDVLDKDGNTKYPDSRLFLIRDAGAKAKVVELKSDGTIVPHAVNKEDVATISSMSLDEYKQAMPESSMIEDNSGEEPDEDSQLANLGLPKGSEIWMNGDGFGRPKENTLSRVVGIDEQGSIILEDKDGKKWSASFDYINNHRELPPLDENTNIVNEENNQSESNAEENTPAPEQTPAITLEDGTIVPMLEDGNPDFSKLTAAQTAELYDTQFSEDAESVISSWVSDAKKALDKASNMTVKGKTFVEQKAAKDAKEKAIADAQAAYDSAIAIRDAYNERQLAKVEDTAEGRKALIEKARRKFARLKSAVKDDAEAVSQLYRDTIGSLLHRLYDSTGIDVTDTTPLTAEEYVASNLGAHSLNYEGTETSKGVKQETGLSREDFAKTQLLAADGKGTTIDALVHSLWENRPSNLESLDTQDIRNALIGVLNSGFKASEARNFVENIRIAQAENILEEQKRAQENAAYAEHHKAEQESELQAKSDEKAELQAKSEAKSEEKTHSESFNKIVDLAKKLEEILDNPDNVKEIDKITNEIDELLETLSDEEFKEVSDALLNIDEDLEYLTADEYERREGVEESKKAKAYNESLKQAIKRIAPYADALKEAVKSGDKKVIANAQKELTDALLASNLGHGYLYGQLEYAKSAKKKDESYSERRALVKPLTDAINAIESALDSALAEAGLEGVHVDFTEGGHGWIYADKGSAWSSRLKDMDNDYRNVSQYETQNPISVLPQITMDNVAKVAGIIKSRIEEGERYNSDEYNDEENEKINEQTNENINAPEVPEDATDENPLGAERDESDLPFSAKENGKQQTTAERAAVVEKNKVDDMKVVDNIVGEKTRKAFERLAKMMGANIQWQYSDKLGNGWIQESKDADGNVHRTIFITLDSSITEGAQFIFGHEMTHQIKNLNPAEYNELTKLVLDTYGSDAFEKAVDETMKRYSDAGFSGRARDYYAEEVVADSVGEMIRDLNLAHTLAMKMSHPLLAAIHEILQKIKLAFFGTEYSDVTKNIIRSIEQAYVKTANGQVTNSETGEDVSYSLRQKPEPKKKGVGYKVFVLKDGKLYPPMVANPDGAATPVGVWLDADAAPIAGESKTGRPQVKQGGKGTQGGSGKLAYRPGWHLGIVPYAIQFNRKDADGNKTLFPKNFVFAEVEYAADIDYQEEARQEGINPSGKYQHSLAGLKHLPTDGYYMYRTNPNPETDPWVITGAMKVNRILTRAEQAELVKNAGREPQQIQDGDIVTDDVVNSINQEIADAPKFSLKVYHGSGADFTEFDFDHMGEGAGSQVFGWGGYVTSSEEIGKSYANLSRDYGSRNIYKGDIQLTKLEKAALSSFIENNKKHEGTFKEGVAGSIERQKALIAKHPNNPLSNSIKKRIEVLEGVMPKLDSISWDDFVPSGKNLYEVDIPEDNGSNYLEWEKKPSDEVATKIIEGLYGLDAKTLDDMASKDIVFRTLLYDYIKNADKEKMIPILVKTNALTRGTTYDNGNVEDNIRFVYNRLSRWMGSPKAASQFLSSLGFTGIKYPSGTIMGGAEENDTNYVIFKPDDMKITQHTKFSLRLKSAIEETETNPSDAQKESGNYKKGHIKFGGYDYTIENPKGSTRSGKDADGKEWKVTMHDTYGYIRGKFGKDGDHLDMFINDKADLDNWNGDVFVVDQVNPDGSFDEHKVMYGYDSMDDAKKAYLANYSKGWQGLGNITGASKDEFDKWLDTSNRKLKPFADYAKVKFSQAQSVSKPLFSLKDEKTLVGVHNITEEKLRKALKLGGFANPSLAVIDTNKSGHNNFGEISFIAPSALLDKRTGKTGGTWITDAYTQRYPSVERQMSEKGSQKFEDWVDSLEYPSAAKAEIKRQTKDVLEDNGVPAWDLMYLKEKGIDIKAYDSNVDYRWKEIINDHPTAEDILSSMKNDPELNEKVTSLAKHAIIYPTWEKVSLEVRRKMYEETGVKASPINPQVRKQTKGIFERDYKSTLLNKDGSPRKKDVKKVVEDIVKEHNDTKKYDFYLSKVKASNYVNKNGLYDDYIRWQENKLDEFGTKNRIFRGYTRDGSRKYVPETLENVSKAMREEADGQTNGSEYTSFGSFIAKLASRVDSIDEMRANKDKLSSNKDKEEFYEKWSEVYYDLAKFLYNDVFYGEQRLHDIVLQSDPKKYAKKEYGITLTPTFMKKLDALKNAVQTELKSAYFETKYNRPLRLNEFAAAVVPYNLGEDVRKGIENAGLPMYNYDPNKEGDRIRAFNEAINSSDNIRFSLKAEKEKIVADAKANGTYMTAPNGEKTKLNAEQWATVRTTNFKNWFGDWENEPENASKVVDKNGEPMVVWHGRSAEFNTFEKKEGVRFIMGLEDKVKAEGFFFSPDKGLAEEFASNSSRHRGGKANVVPCFLNIRRPMDLTGEDYDRIYEDVTGWEYMVGMDTQDNLWGIMDEEGMADKIKEKGYDGAIFVEEVDDSYEPTKISYCAMDANQIKSAENNNGDFSADNNDIRFSLAGERGAAAADKAEERTFRMDNLSVARKMEEDKKDAKAIKMATGWERGADGKWRYEMPDAKIKLGQKVTDNIYGEDGKVIWYDNERTNPIGTLKDLLDAPELFKAYPELKNIKVAILNANQYRGAYSEEDKTIFTNITNFDSDFNGDRYLSKDVERNLVHEIQHIIQTIEGFGKGGNSGSVRGEIKKKFDEVTKQIRQLKSEGKNEEAKALIEKNKALYNANVNEKDDYKNYLSLAGEVEARNVSARLNMTSEERRKTLAESTEDVARKDQIFLGVGDVSFSLRDMADGKESGAADMAEDLKSLNTPDEVDDAIKTAIDDMPSGWQMANKKMIHIAQALGENRKAEIAGEEPRFSLKDGTLIKAGTYFSGGGLVEEGLKGIIDPVVAVEYDEKISGVYRNNFGQHIVTADVRDVDPRELVKQIDGEVEYFHASPVCKNYSQAKSNHAEVELDKETAASTAEFINAIKPKVVTIENVKGYKDSEAMKIITDALDANGYTWDADVYNAADYGGYTNRERLIVRAVRDGKLPEKPKKMAHKSGWYEAVADIIPTLTEKKNGVAPWMDIRLKADGIDWRNIDKPLYVMGSAYADGKVPHAFADELLPTLRTKSGDVIVMPDGKVYRAMGRVLARVSGVSDDYKMPFSENLSHTIIGNGIPTQLTEHVIAPLLTGSDPKFSIRTYHGTGASFDKFDFSHMSEGEGSQAFGWGGYVTNSKEIAEDYTRRAKIRKDNGGFEFVTDMSANNKDMVRQYIYKHKDVNKGLDAMRKDISSALEMFPDDDNLKELSDILAKKNEEIAVPDDIAYLYDVDIPDDNGDYLDWENKLKKSHLNKVNKELVRIGKEPIETIYPSRVDGKVRGQDLYDELSSMLGSKEAASKLLSDAGFIGIKYPAGTIYGGAKNGDTNYVIFDENNANIVGNTRFSLRYDQFEHDLNQWKKDNNLPKDAQRPTIPQRNAGESAVDFLRRVDEYRKQMALWKTAPTYEQHLLSDDTAIGEFNRELQRGSVLKRIAFQDSMLAIRKSQEAIMKEVGVDRLNMAEDAYTAENRSHGKGKNEFEEYNNEFLQPLRKAYHQMKKVLGDSYDNVRIYMMAKHGLERDAQMAFKMSLDADYDDVAQRSAAYKAYKGDMNRIINDSDLEFGRVDFNTWRQRDNALRAKYSPSYMDYRYDKNGIVYDYSGLSALFDGSDFEEAAYKLVKDIEDKYVTETHDLWDATNAATKKILRDGYKAGMMSKDTYQYVRDMYSHYIPLRGWDGTTADQVWDYVGGGKGAFNQTLKTAHGRTSIADDPIAYIENMAESGILLNNKNWVKQHLMILAQNHPTSLLTLSKAWYVKSTDANGNEEWIPATPQITSQMNSNQVKAAIDAFENKMEQMAQTGDATQKRDGLNIAYPQTHSEEREHEVRVMKDGEEYVIYVNGDPQLAQAMNNTRAHRVSEGIKNSISKRVIAVVGRKMAAAYTSLSPLFIPSNYFRDLTMTLASTAIREDAKYNYLLRKNLVTSWNLGFMLRDYQSGKLREKVSNGNATPKEQMFYDFMMNGGETGFVSSLDVEDLKKKFKNDLKDLNRWKANPVKVGHTIMDSIEFLNRAIEDSNRFAVYMTSIQYGRSIDEAVNDAKNVTLNFNRKGTGEHSWQTIRNLYLFINPAVQSLQTLGALAKHHPFKFTAVTASWIASGVLVPIVNAALMQMAAAFLGGDGDDDKDWYKDISKKYWQFSKWDRRNNFIMWVPTTHEFVKIPLAQEFRAFYGLGDMIASKMMGGELAEESWEDYGWDLVGQVVDMLPLDPTGYDGELGVSLMPNPIRPVFELAFNVDFTGKPLFKDTEYNKYDPNFTKAYVGTPDWLVRASKMVNSIGNDYPDVQQNSIDAFGDPRYNLNNPAVVDHVLSSYLGGAYTMGSQVLGLLTKSLNDPKEIKVADIPLFSKFVSNPDDRPVSKKQGDEFWDKKEYYDRAANTISKLKKQAKIDGDYSLLERFYSSEEYKKYKLYEKDVNEYKEARKKERAEESGDEYRPHQLNDDDIYKNHATPMDEFEDMKLKQLFEKLNSFKTRYDAIVDNAPNESDSYYNTNNVAIDAIDEISLDKQEISELKKGFLDDGKDSYNVEDMKRIRYLRKKILSVLEKANKVVVANQKAKADK